MEGRGEAALCDRGVSRVRAADSAGAHFDERVDSAAGRQALASVAPLDLRDRAVRRHSLLLARQIGSPAAAPLWRDPGRAAAVPTRRFPAEATASREHDDGGALTARLAPPKAMPSTAGSFRVHAYAAP